MHSKTVKGFRVVTIIRCISLLMIFVLDELRSASYNSPGSFDLDLDIHFSFWQHLLIGLFALSLFGNSIISLLLSFKSSLFFKSFLSNRYILTILYIGELVALVLMGNTAIEEVNDRFFPKKSILDSFLPKVFAPQNDRYYTIAKLEAINYCLVVLCLLLFLILFWMIYKQGRKRYEETFHPAFNEN